MNHHEQQVQDLNDNLEHVSEEFTEFIHKMKEKCELIGDWNTYSNIVIRDYILENFNSALNEELGV